MYSTLKRQKSISSHAASISAWCAVFDCPSIVAAFSVCAPRAGEQLRRAQEHRGALLPRRARPVVPGLARPPSIARSTSLRAALVDGRRGRAPGRAARPPRRSSPVRTSSPPITSGMSICCDSQLREASAELLPLGRARRVVANRLVVRLGDAEDSVGAHAVDSRMTARGRDARRRTRWTAGAWASSGSRTAASSGTSLPSRGRRRRMDGGGRRSSSGCARTSTGEDDAFEDVDRSISSTRRRSSSAARQDAARGPARRGRHVRRARRARRLAWRSACRRHVLRAQPARRSSFPATASSRRRPRLVRLARARATSGGCSSSRVRLPLSRSSATSWRAIAPERDCDRLAELSGLFHVAGSVHLRGRGEVALHLDLTSSAVARRAFALLRALDVESEIRDIPAARVRPGDALPAPCGGHCARSYETLHRAGDRSTRRTGRWTQPPQRVLVAPLLPPRISPRRAARRRLAQRAARPASRDRGRRRSTAPAFSPTWRRATGVELRVLDRGRHAVAYAKGADRSRTCSSPRARRDTVLVLEEHAVLAAIRADANRLANADHANLVRTSRAAHAQLEAVPGARPRRAAG